jgi:hypothetical protein
MSSRKRPHPAYWEYLYIQVGGLAAIGVASLLAQAWALGGILLALAAVELTVLVIYKRRTEHE